MLCQVIFAFLGFGIIYDQMNGRRFSDNGHSLEFCVWFSFGKVARLRVNETIPGDIYDDGASKRTADREVRRKSKMSNPGVACKLWVVGESFKRFKT